jgi:hypothetical protein
MEFQYKILSWNRFWTSIKLQCIEEVEVITGGFNAEFGQATSGIVNVKTREGGDKYNGFFHIKEIILVQGLQIMFLTLTLLKLI